MTRASSSQRFQSLKTSDTGARAEFETRPARVRTAKACRLCNKKRVKCDASERGTPCTRCEQRGESDCTLIQSRRGIYVRKPRRQQTHACSTTGLDGPETNNVSHQMAGSASSKKFNTQTTSQSELHHARSSTAPASAQKQRAAAFETTDASNDSTNRNASWSTVFETFLQQRRNRGGLVEKGSITYVGEAFPLGIILDGSKGNSERPIVHHLGPHPIPREETANSGNTCPEGISAEDMAFLEAKQTFTAPSDEILEIFIRVFFERVFPLYPVVNPQELLQQHRTRKIPWILLHTVCYVSATFCPMRILHKAGFDDRKQARARFYGKAKALFDIGYETSKIVTLQVVILLSTWGGSPTNYWNFYTWISIGVTTAETIGCHRSMAGLNIAPHDRSLLKRLWWILVIRDAACASMHGRPFRINLDHCDVDELTSDDFDYDSSAIAICLASVNVQLSGSYQIQAAKLALLLRQIVKTRFYPQSQDVTSSPILHEMLIHWRNGLPAPLQWTDNTSTHKDVFRTTLCVLYNHNVILSHIKPETATDNRNVLPLSSWLGDEIVSLSAQQIASIACSMVTTSDELLPPHEFFHAIFIACVVFFIQARSSRPMTASLGRSGLTNCRMVLHAHRYNWDASLWIIQLFDEALARAVADTDSTGRADVPLESSNMDQNSGASLYDISETNNLFPDSFEGWPSHPFLGELFDPTLSTNAFGFTIPGYEQPYS